MLGRLEHPSRFPKLGFLANDLARKTLELFARLESEIVVERTPCPLVDLERVRMTTRTVERDHELRDEALAIRGLVDQPAELAHELCVATQGQIRVDADLECPRAKLVEALGLGAGVEVQRDAREDRAVPETQRLLGEGCGSSVVAERRCLGSLLYERLEDERVENGPAEADPVAASSSLEGNPVRRERLTKP
jgi:hypothetical protein